VKKITLSANTLAQYGHFMTGVAVVFASKIFFRAPVWGGIVLLTLIAVKEAFVDPAIEEGATIVDGVEDLSWYATGIVTAIVMVLIFGR